MHMFTASAQNKLILTNTGMNSSCRMNLLYNDDTVLYSLTIKKAAKQIPGRFIATIIGSTF